MPESGSVRAMLINVSYALLLAKASMTGSFFFVLPSPAERLAAAVLGPPWTELATFWADEPGDNSQIIVAIKARGKTRNGQCLVMMGSRSFLKIMSSLLSSVRLDANEAG